MGALATIVDPRPADVRDQLVALTDALDRVVPARTGENLLIGTWNVRAFSRLRPAWRSTAGDSPIRDLSNACCIAEVVRRFDVTAIQEVAQRRRAAGDDAGARPELGVRRDRRDGGVARQRRAAGLRVRPRPGVACRVSPASWSSGRRSRGCPRAR